MSQIATFKLTTLLAVLVLFALTGSGCYEAVKTVTPKAGSPTATPSAGGTVSVSPTASESPSPAATGTSSQAPKTVELNTNDNFFAGKDFQGGGSNGTPVTLTIPAGQLTIKGKNMGSAIHDVHLKGNGVDKVSDP